MKKSLIALLVASMPAAAFADVTIYGAIKAGVENLDLGGKAAKQTNIDDLGSRIGFKGSEDLGNGLKAIWQVESGFAIDGNSDGTNAGKAYTGGSTGTLANRNSFLGLQSNLGTLRFGNVSNYLDSDMGLVDAWSYNSQILGLGIFTRDATRLKNSVRYDLPAVVPGLTASLQYGTKEDKSAASQQHETSIVGLGYENSGFFGKYAYTHESEIAGIANDKHRVEVGYNANNLFVGLGYQQEQGASSLAWNGFAPQTVVAGAKTKTSEYALTASYSFGAITPKFTYAHGDNVKYNSVKQDNTGYDQYLLGADYALSKRTTVGAQYGELKFKGYDKQKALGLNLVHNF
ncbi:porin [Chromobacterium sp. IIBBL 290-4]|uniref:porin n=1 Tax=Chromobacterium sp. IIBBL 290-4 TaxID=2953890 RepID=UPI0020B68BEC|nr:porin [Chromobacterium sp. IIBBL 290-4]UTH72682.1 porin [Chromobacterium sp. IIBBL 290-4]